MSTWKIITAILLLPAFNLLAEAPALTDVPIRCQKFDLYFEGSLVPAYSMEFPCLSGDHEIVSFGLFGKTNSSEMSLPFGKFNPRTLLCIKTEYKDHGFLEAIFVENETETWTNKFVESRFPEEQFLIRMPFDFQWTCEDDCFYGDSDNNTEVDVFNWIQYRAR